MKALRTYNDCSLCNGTGVAKVYAPQYDKRGMMTCVICTERYLIECRTVLHDLLHEYGKLADAIPAIEKALQIEVIE